MKKLFVMFGALMIISRVALAGEVPAPEAITTRVSMSGEEDFYHSENGKARTKDKVIAKEEANVQASIIHKKGSRKALVALFSTGKTKVTYAVLDVYDKVLYSEKATVNGQAAKAFSFEAIEGAVTLRVSDSKGVVKYKTL